MRVLIQHREHLLYWKSENCWVSELNEAHDFQTTVHAIREALHCHLENVQLVLSFPEPEHNLRMPILSTLRKIEAKQDWDIPGFKPPPPPPSGEEGI